MREPGILRKDLTRLVKKELQIEDRSPRSLVEHQKKGGTGETWFKIQKSKGLVLGTLFDSIGLLTLRPEVRS